MTWGPTVPLRLNAACPTSEGLGLLLSVTRRVEAVVAGQTARLCRLPAGKSLCPRESGCSGGAFRGVAEDGTK